MSGSAPSNTAAVDFEKQQAAAADAKEAARQDRLTQGQTLIDQIFNGQPVMDTKTAPFDWSTFQAPSAALTTYAGASGQPEGTYASGVPKDYTAVQAVRPTAAGAVQPGASSASFGAANRGAAAGSGRGYSGGSGAPAPVAGAGGAAGAKTWALKGPDGKLYFQGDPFDVTTSTDTGKRTGGFDDAFYNAYNQKVLDYYNPQEARQYDVAQRDLRYKLANAGTLQSSMAADTQGDLGYQDALNKADIVANANKQTGELRNQIQSNKETLINQLYATEDPTLTANLAQSSVNATRLQNPTLTPAAALFTPAVVGGASALSGLASPYNPYTAQPTNPAPAPASAGSGKLTNYN
jgi:hypothetical protein